MKLPLWAFALAMTSITAPADSRPAMTVEEEARALIGKEYTFRMQGQRISPELSCTSEGGGLLFINGVFDDEWASGAVKCQGRAVEVLKRAVGEADGDTTWRIIDTLVLPPYKESPNPKRPNALRLAAAGPCELDGRTDTFFIALVRMGKRDRIDWRTGVEKAWTYDIERGRIVPLSTKRIVCYRPEPA